MQYFGGKQRILKQLVPVIEEHLKNCSGYWEPFCGGLSVFSAIQVEKPKVASDFCAPLIELYKYCQYGGILPDTITEQDYREAKEGKREDWYKAFAGFGCSFAGKWFGGYARGGEGRNYCLNAKNSLVKKFKGVKSSDQFLSGDYRDHQLSNTSGWLIYCDPPYAGTTGYNAANTWDVASFWEWVKCRKTTNTVLVSEYSAPDWATCIASIQTKTDIRDGSGNQSKRVEKLFLA